MDLASAKGERCEDIGLGRWHTERCSGVDRARRGCGRAEEGEKGEVGDTESSASRLWFVGSALRVASGTKRGKRKRVEARGAGRKGSEGGGGRAGLSRQAARIGRAAAQRAVHAAWEPAPPATTLLVLYSLMPDEKEVERKVARYASSYTAGEGQSAVRASERPLAVSTRKPSPKDSVRGAGEANSHLVLIRPSLASPSSSPTSKLFVMR